MFDTLPDTIAAIIRSGVEAFLSNPFLLLSLLVSFAAYPAYAYAIRRQGTRPTRPTWIMIFVVDVLLFVFALKAAHVDMLLLGFTAGNLFMLVLMANSDLAAARGAVLKLGTREWLTIAVFGNDTWTKKDFASVAVALGAFALYKLTGSGVTAICFSLIGKIAASVPMWFNLWKEPHREAMLPWAIWLVGGILYVVAIPSADYSFVVLATPTLFVILETLVLLLLARRFLPSCKQPVAAVHDDRMKIAA